MPQRSLSPVRRPLLRSRSADTRGLARQTSFNVKSLTRGLSFSRKHVRSSNNPGEDEVNLFMSDMVTKEYCLEKLEEVKQHTAVVKMEIEDLLVSRHSSMIPIIKQLVVNGSGREWEWIRFTDTTDADDFVVWQGKKHNICQGFEATVADKSKYENVMSFECTIRLPRGTSHMDAKKVLQGIQEDNTVTKWSFEGSLYNFDDDKKPTMLQRLIDAESGNLVDEVVVNIRCGWNAKLAEGSKMLLEKCIQVMKKPESEEEEEEEGPKEQEETGSKTPIRRTRTSLSPPRPQMPRRRTTMRRCMSSDGDEPGRDVRRTVSMPTQHRRTTLSPVKERRNARDVPSRRPRRVTSPPKQLEEEDAPEEDEQPTRGRNSETSTRTSVTSTTSTVSTLSSGEDSDHQRLSIGGSGREMRQRGRTPPRRMRSFATGGEDEDDDRRVASVPVSPRKSSPRRIRSLQSSSATVPEEEVATAAIDAAPRMPTRASLSPNPSSKKRATPRRTKSAAATATAAGTANPDFNWSNFTDATKKTTECDITPDFDWKTGVYMNPMTSKAA